MRKESRDFIFGLTTGLMVSLITFLTILHFYGTDAKMEALIQGLKEQKVLGKLIALSGIPNLILFFGFLHYKKEFLARGVILCILLLAIITLFV